MTVHCGEVSNESEFLAVMEFRPDRLGHAVVLGEEARKALLSVQPPIPIEVCPTSNLLTLALSDHGDHPTVRGWIEQGWVMKKATITIREGHKLLAARSYYTRMV